MEASNGRTDQPPGVAVRVGDKTFNFDDADAWHEIDDRLVVLAGADVLAEFKTWDHVYYVGRLTSTHSHP